MKKEGKDFNGENEFSEKMKEKGWREIDRAARPNRQIEKSLRASKNRITIYLDAEIIDFFKKASKNTGDGYQTLINRKLRQMIADENIKAAQARQAVGAKTDSIDEIAAVVEEKVKKSILKDKSFLNKLATTVNK